MITYKYANVFSCTGLWSDPDGNKTLLILCSHLGDGVRDVASNLHNVSGGLELQRGRVSEGINQ